MSKIEVYIGSPTGGLNSHGKWCSWDDLTDEERIRWVEGQNAADEAWERRKNGISSPTLRSELIERANNELLMHC